MTNQNAPRKPAVFRITKTAPEQGSPTPDTAPANSDIVKSSPPEPQEQAAISEKEILAEQEIREIVRDADALTRQAPVPIAGETEPFPDRHDARQEQPLASQFSQDGTQKRGRKPTVVKTTSLSETPFPEEQAPHINDDGSDDYIESDWNENHTITKAAIPSLDEIKKGLRWGNLLFSAITGLIMLAALSWALGYVNDLFARKDIIGWVSLGLFALIILALVMIAIRELWALRRLKNMNKLRIDAELAIERNDTALAKGCTAQLKKMLGDRKDLKWAFGRMDEHEQDLRNGREMMTLTERELMKPLDIQARAIVAGSARRVSVITAISPFALLDMGFVAYENIKMLRRLSLLYGGQPGTFSTFRVIGMIVSHLAITGGVALADDLMKQLLSHSVAAKLSARLGQGLLNGALTARIGIVATGLIRPLPYIERKPPNFQAMVKEVFRPGT